MKNRTRIAAVVGAAALTLTVGVAPAQAIDIINPFSCTADFFTKHQYFTLIINNPLRPGASPLCFANAGTRHVHQPNVTGFYSGNNRGIFSYIPKGTSETRYWFFDKGNNSGFHDFGTVTGVSIA